MSVSFAFDYGKDNQYMMPIYLRFGLGKDKDIPLSLPDTEKATNSFLYWALK